MASQSTDGLTRTLKAGAKIDSLGQVIEADVPFGAYWPMFAQAPNRYLKAASNKVAPVAHESPVSLVNAQITNSYEGMVALLADKLTVVRMFPRLAQYNVPVFSEFKPGIGTLKAVSQAQSFGYNMMILTASGEVWSHYSASLNGVGATLTQLSIPAKGLYLVRGHSNVAVIADDGNAYSFSTTVNGSRTPFQLVATKPLGLQGKIIDAQGSFNIWNIYSDTGAAVLLRLGDYGELGADNLPVKFDNVLPGSSLLDIYLRADGEIVYDTSRSNFYNFSAF